MIRHHTEIAVSEYGIVIGRPNRRKARERNVSGRTNFSSLAALFIPQSDSRGCCTFSISIRDWHNDRGDHRIPIRDFRYGTISRANEMARTTWMEQRRCWSCNFASLYEFGQVRIAETVEESVAESWSNLCRITTWTRSRGARRRSISDNASK